MDKDVALRDSGGSLSHKRDETGPFAEEWMDTKIVMKSEASQKEKNEYCKLMHTYMGNLKNGISSVAQSCPTLCDPMNRSTPGLPVRQYLPEFTQTRVYRVSDTIQPSHPRSSPFSPAPNPSQHQSLVQ